MLLAQDDDDENVGEKGHGQDHRHDEPVNWHGQLGRAVPRGTVDVVALALVPTIPQDMDLKRKAELAW